MLRIDLEHPADAAARDDLLDRAIGEERVLKPSERLREGRLPARGLALVARDGAMVVGTVRLWHVAAGDRDLLMLGPLAVDPDRQGAGIGSRLIRAAVVRARSLAHAAIVLVGDPEYYGRFGFVAASAAGLVMPGRVERRRMLALELTPGALAGVRGTLVATGAFAAVAPMAPASAGRMAA